MSQHPNLVPIEGIAARLGVPAEHTHALNYEAQTLTAGNRLFISTAVAEACIETIPGMGIAALTEPYNGLEPYTVNAVRRKVGFLRESSVDGDLLRVKGYVYGWDFPDLMKEIAAGTLGMCLAVTYPIDSEVRDGVVHLRQFVCTGIGLLRREHCGFQGTEVSFGKFSG